jgi:hypothetical protein
MSLLSVLRKEESDRLKAIKKKSDTKSVVVPGDDLL